MNYKLWVRPALLLVIFAALAVAVTIGCMGRPGVPPDEALERVRAKGGEFANLGKDSPPEEWLAAAAKEYKPAEYDYFAAMDYAAGPDGKVGPLKLDPEEIKGRNAWVLWAGGNDAFWDWLARHSYGSIDLLKLIDSEERGKRFKRWGGMTTPGTRSPRPDEIEKAYGVRFERMQDDAKAYRLDSTKPYENSYPDNAYMPDPKVYGYPTGVVGLYLFWNPEFLNSKSARDNWNADKYYNDPEYAARRDTIRPFRVGMSCGFCHIAPHPLSPPADPEYPAWANLSNNIGNQFMRFRGVFGNTLTSDNLLYHVLDSQHPGTIDTSLVAADNINNPNTVNSFYGLRGRLERAAHNPKETIDGETLGYLRQYVKPLVSDEDKKKLDKAQHYVPRVLLDGSDSVGVHIALSRVYLNIGTHHQRWVQLHNTLLGFRKQEPFKLRDVAENSLYWHATLLRVNPMAAFFRVSTNPMHLKDAPMGKELGKLRGDGTSWYAAPPEPKKADPKPEDPKKVDPKPEDPKKEMPKEEEPKDYAVGRSVFAKGCIACHSSVQPGDLPSLEKLIVADGLPADRTGLRLRMQDLTRLTRGDGKLPDPYAKWAQEAVKYKEFWEHKTTEQTPDGKGREVIVHNFLSTDARIPVTLTHTNSARAMATNAVHDNIWEDFASQTYKELDSVGRITYRDPFSGAQKSFPGPSNGPGFYRVPTLISIWATAPFLHNNALGLFNNETSVKGRLEAFDDGIRRLLWPELRIQPTKHWVWHRTRQRDEEPKYDAVPVEQIENDGGWVWRTKEKTSFKFGGHHIPTFVSGVTGWPPRMVDWLPWIPSILFIVLGVLLLASGTIISWRQSLERKVSWAEWVLAPVRWVAVVGGFILFLVAGYLVWFEYRFLVELLGVALKTPRWWLWLQVSSVPLFFLALSMLFLLARFQSESVRRRKAKFFGALALVWAVVLALGFGRFVSGRGGDVEFGPFPPGMAVNLIANLDPNAPGETGRIAREALIDYVLEYHRNPEMNEKDALERFEQRVAPALLNASKCPDFVTDRGHDYEFLRHLTDKEKNELIALLKTF